MLYTISVIFLVLVGACPAWSQAEEHDDPVIAELNRVSDLSMSNNYEETTDAALALWQRILEDDDHLGVPLIEFAPTLEHLAAVHPPAHARLTRDRDRAGEALRRGDVTWSTLTEWVYLNDILDEEEATIEWFDRISEREDADETLRRFEATIVKQALWMHEWAIVAAVLSRPVDKAKEEIAEINFISVFNEEDLLRDVDFMEWRLKGPVVSALHAKDDGTKERELVEYLKHALPEHDAWRMAFITIAKECGRLRDDHFAWIDEYGLDEQFPEQAQRISPGH